MATKLNRKWIAVIAVGVGLLLLWLCCLPSELFRNTSYSTIVLDANGELLGARLADDEQWRFPACDSVPYKFEKALIEFEDRTFYRHCGVSFRALGRALVQNLRSGRIVSGASTISMQVIRLSRRRERTIGEKLIEIFMSTRLETRYSKQEILRLYASHAPFGGNVVGINAALWRYLGNDGADISWAEAATLAVLQNAPSSVHLAKNRDTLKAKRDRLLKRLYEKGEIGPYDYELALDEPLIGQPYDMPMYAPHYVSYCDQYYHGKKCLTHIDLSIQKRFEELLNRWSGELRKRGARDLAAVVMDVESQQIIAYCGNADLNYNRDGKWVDIARSPRSSGSILKPLLYGAALEDGVILPKSLLPDVPSDFGGFAPKNFDGTYQGAIEADKALELSLNVPNVKLLQDYGIGRFAKVLKSCGFSSLKKADDEYGLSLVLGGAEVKLLDIVSCYAKMAAIYCDSTRCQGFPLRDRVALYSTFASMRDVYRADRLDWRRASSAQNIAWKTGTSYGARDAWAVGLTPGYVIGVWVGNADGSGVAEMTGAHTAGPVLFELFSILPYSAWFEEPREDDGRMVSVCRHSGHLAGRFCSETSMELVPKAGLSSGVCPYCREVYVASSVSADNSAGFGLNKDVGIGLRVDSSDAGDSAARDNAGGGIGRGGGVDLSASGAAGMDSDGTSDGGGIGRNDGVSWAAGQLMKCFVLPPLMEHYYKPLHPEYEGLPMGAVSSYDAKMSFIYPSDGSIVSLPRLLDGSQGELICKVAHTQPSIEIFWHLDDHYLGSTRDLHHKSIAMEPGFHTITIVDAQGNEQAVSVIVR